MIQTHYTNTQNCSAIVLDFGVFNTNALQGRSSFAQVSCALFLTAISSRSADLAHKVHWTLCLKPNHALKELEMRYAISSSVKARSRSSASALSGSALRIAFSRYALSEKAGRRAKSGKQPTQK